MRWWAKASCFYNYLLMTPLITLSLQLRGNFLGLMESRVPASSTLNALITVLFCPISAASLLPHRFVTVRRGSPAAKSGQIRPGDRLEAVEGRSVVTLPHRELAQILRRAGNTLRLTIVPRSSTCRHSHKHPNIHICHSAKLGFYFTIRP